MAEPNGQRVIIVVDSERQREAFVDTITKLGLTLVDCIHPKLLKAEGGNGSQVKKDAWKQADIWLIDSCYDDQLYRVLEHMSNGLMLVGFEQAPEPSNLHHYLRWQRKLNRKISHIINRPLLDNTKAISSKFRPWQHVVLLGVTKQDLMAVKIFLGLLPSSLPVVILLVHNVAEPEVYGLPQQLSQHNQWQSQVISLSMNMQAGHCYIVPPTPKVVFDSTGRAILVPEESVNFSDCDEDEVCSSPNLVEIIENCSDVFGEQLISILFSHAKLTIAPNLEKFHQNRSQIWLQNGFEITNPSITSDVFGLPQNTCTPIELAQSLLSYLESE